MNETLKKKFETRGTFVTTIREDACSQSSELVMTRRVASEDDSLAWIVKVTVSPEQTGDKWNLRVDVSAVRPGDPEQPRRVLAQGSVSAYVWSEDKPGTTEPPECPVRACSSCALFVGRPDCSKCKAQWPKTKKFPLSEPSTWEPLRVRVKPNSSSSSDIYMLKVTLSMTHCEDPTNLTACEERKSAISRLEGLLASGSLADVTFVVSGEEIKAHRAILGAASSVFLAMFTIDTEDKRTGRVEILDVGPAAFKEMLRNLYTDLEPRWILQDEDSERLLMELLQLSEKYDLHNLLELCKARLLSTLSVENVCYRLKMVDVQCPSLVPLITVPFMKGHLQEVLTSPAWVAFEKENLELAARVMRNAITS